MLPDEGNFENDYMQGKVLSGGNVLISLKSLKVIIILFRTNFYDKILQTKNKEVVALKDIIILT